MSLQVHYWLLKTQREGGTEGRREAEAMGQQEAPAQHLLDENIGRRVPAWLGRSRSRPPQATGDPIKHSSQLREEEMLEGRGTGGGGRGIKNTTGRHRNSLEAARIVCRPRCSGLGRISGGSLLKTPRGGIKKSTRRGWFLII